MRRYFIVLALGAVPFFFLTALLPPKTPVLVRDQIRERIWRDYGRASGMIESEPQKTTSESQSYGMLIAVASNDRARFDLIWRWTREHLAVRGDHLFSWLWMNGGIRDRHSATDADEDIALALILAARRWDEPHYLEEAKEILQDIWEKDTVTVGGIRYISGGDWALEDRAGVLLNPSYFSPASYRIFAKIDPAHDWESLASSSYRALAVCRTGSGLPRNWCRLDIEGSFAADYGFDSDGRDPNLFSFDALRVPFRIGLDHVLAGNPQALRVLEENAVLIRDWSRHKKFFAVYDPDGTPQESYESLASYGATLAGLAAIRHPLADKVWREKIAAFERTTSISFFDLAWLWFGLDFYTGEFPELIRSVR